jgi:hypothetical protein
MAAAESHMSLQQVIVDFARFDTKFAHAPRYGQQDQSRARGARKQPTAGDRWTSPLAKELKV